MRTRIWFLIAAAILLCILLVFHRTVLHQQAASRRGVASPVKQAIQFMQSHTESPRSATNAAPVEPQASSESPTNLNALDRWRLERVLEEARTPIFFYGKVVDEKGNPIAEAAIHFVCSDLSKGGTSEYDRKSDEIGLFSLTGIRGKGISVYVSKQGYYSSRGNRENFEYAGVGSDNFVADENNPIVFVLRKKGVGVPLISLRQNYGVPRDGTPLGINLTTGQITTGGTGDIVVQCWTDDQGRKSGEKYGWRCHINVPGGGLVLTSEEFPVLAPAVGYMPSTEIAMPADRADWTPHVDIKFYFRLASGNYGRMTFSMVAGGHHFCMIDSSFNPSASRNLEPAE